MNAIRPLQYFAVLLLLIPLLLITLFLTGILNQGQYQHHTNAAFIIHTLAVVVTLIAIPLAMRLNRFSCVRNDIRRNNAHIMWWTLVRVCIIALPLIAFTLCYFLFCNTAFAYLAIILCLAYCFVFPTHQRILYEMTQYNNHTTPNDQTTNFPNDQTTNLPNNQ